MNTSKLLDVLRLPAEVSEYEHQHLTKTNKLAMQFFAAHLPVFVAIGYFNGTGAISAAVLTMFFLAGPLVAMVTFDNPRVASVTHGIAGMCLGGVLVHLGQGPVQIEMHFYFFILLAMLTIFANPMVIWAATVTVALHHTVIFYLFPESVFNYDASLWVVALHAGFVVLEASVVAFIARDYFDRVIGLERIVASRTEALEKRNDDMALILENVHDGFLTLSPDMTVGSEYSRILETWFGPAEGRSFTEWIGRKDPSAASWFELGWEMLVGGMMPAEVCIDQLPNEIVVDDLTLGVEYQALETDDVLESLIVNITDRTAEKLAERADAENREMMHLFEKVMTDRAGFLEFFAEADEMLSALAARSWPDVQTCKRWLHTVKGNAMLFGLDVVGEHAHTLEAFMIEENREPSTSAMAPLLERWDRLKIDLEKMLGTNTQSRVELDDSEYENILRAVIDGTPYADLAAMIRRWKLESTEVRLQRIADQAAGIAERLGKDNLTIQTRAGRLYLAPDNWSGFWGAFVHVVRNAVDHGIDTPDERLAKGKPARANLWLETRLEDDAFIIEVRDDGQGIDIDRVRTKAEAAGLTVESEADVLDALFHDGLSTRDVATDFSGRGVGMGAVKEAAQALGGKVEVESTRGRGTTFRFVFPKGAMTTRVRAVA